MHFYQLSKVKNKIKMEDAMDPLSAQQPATAISNQSAETDNSDADPSQSDLEQGIDIRARASARQLSALKKDITAFTAEAELLDANLEYYEEVEIANRPKSIMKNAINDLKAQLAWFQKIYKNILVAKSRFVFEEDIAVLLQATKASYTTKTKAMRVLMDNLTELVGETAGGGEVEALSRERKDKETSCSRGDEYFYKHLLPKVELAKFNGQTLSDSMAYYRFRSSFMEVVVRRAALPGALKLTFLKANLTGPAYQAVAHFTTEDVNFDRALQTLDELYLDRDKIVQELWRNLRSLKPNRAQADCAYSNIVEYISAAKGIISDLNSMGVDCEASSVGNLFCSHIIFEGLPFVVQNEIIIKVNTNYPNLKQIFETYPFAINKLMLKYQHKDYKDNVQRNKQNNNNTNQKPSKVNVVSSRGSTKTGKQAPLPKRAASGVAKGQKRPERDRIEAVASSYPSHGSLEPTEKRKPCKLCSSQDHSSSRCKEFPSVQTRVARIRELNLCTKCMSSMHDVSQCTYFTLLFPFSCQHCDSRKHITPLCDSNRAQSQ